ncbi:hypothetical protein N7499_002556 [Penicillium canescens]|nr:hypothetical protein N7499_002556 [Penicillium canescens]KAJ6166171.1 hypothetical protein N7485_009415 [Penicillium canescens]
MSFVNSLARYTLFLSLFTLITCFQPVPNNPVGDYNDQCADALTTNLTSYIVAVHSLSSNNFYSKHGLDKIYTSDCRDELLEYRKATCLKNQGNYYNIVLGNLTKNSRDDYNKCLLLKLRNKARYPYSSGPNMYSSAYPSYTSSYGFTGYLVTAKPTVSPNSTVSSTLTLSVAATPTASTYSGKKYTIKDGDTCESVSKSQSVATYQLLIDNQLQAYCANFPKSGNLCIKNHCTTYIVQKGDTYKSVAKEHNITRIDGGCYNFNRTIGTEICIDKPREKYHALSSVISATGLPTASTKNCGEYYTPKSNKTYDTIVQNFPISRVNFLILNPGLNQNCTNFIASRSYCVKPVKDIDNYPGALGYMPSGDLPNATYTPVNNPNPLPIAPGTLKDYGSLIDGHDLQYNYTGVSNYQAAGTFWKISQADLLRWNPSLKKLKSNSTSCDFSKKYRYCMDGPGASASSSGAVPSTPAPSTPLTTSTSSSTSSPAPTSTSTSRTSTTDKDTSTSSKPTSTTATPTSTNGAVPSPTQSNSIADNCSDYAKAKDGDNCIDFAKDHDITPKQLYQWNTVLGDGGKECGTMFQKDTYYCVGVSE